MALRHHPRRTRSGALAVPLTAWLGAWLAVGPPAVTADTRPAPAVSPGPTVSPAPSLDPRLPRPLPTLPPRVSLGDVPLTGPVVTGAAAIHEHAMAEYAFSGKWHWGSVDGPENVSLGRCDGDDRTHAGADLACSILASVAGKDRRLSRISSRPCSDRFSGTS